MPDKTPEAASKSKKILIAGYHGFGNCGDEAILLAMKNNIQSLYPDVELTALSFRPADTEEIYKIQSVHRFKLFEVLRAIYHTDILISGGGSLLQDETSTRSLLYYLCIVFTAKLFGKKVMLYANGIGPVSHNISKLLIRLIINHVDLITLREDSSFDEIRSLGVQRPPVYVTADPAFTLNGCSKQEVEAIFEKEGIPTDKPFIGLSIRPWKNIDNFENNIAALCDYLCEKHDVNLLIIPMQRSTDSNISVSIQTKMRHPSYVLRGKYSSDEILGIIGTFEIILSMRLHTLIFAGVQTVPMLGFVYDPKVKSYLKLMQMPEAGDLAQLDMDTVKNIADDLFENNAAHRERLAAITGDLKEKAKLNDELLKDLL